QHAHLRPAQTTTFEPFARGLLRESAVASHHGTQLWRDGLLVHAQRFDDSFGDGLTGLVDDHAHLRVVPALSGADRGEPRLAVRLHEVEPRVDAARPDGCA